MPAIVMYGHNAEAEVHNTIGRLEQILRDVEGGHRSGVMCGPYARGWNDDVDAMWGEAERHISAAINNLIRIREVVQEERQRQREEHPERCELSGGDHNWFYVEQMEGPRFCMLCGKFDENSHELSRAD